MKMATSGRLMKQLYLIGEVFCICGVEKPKVSCILLAVQCSLIHDNKNEAQNSLAIPWQFPGNSLVIPW